MAHAEFMGSTLTEQRLAALELRFRRTRDALTSARATCASINDLDDANELEERRALASVQHLQGALSDLQTAMELLEDGVTV